MNASAEPKLNVYHVESRDGRLGPYFAFYSKAEYRATNIVFDSLFGETVGGAREKALRDVITGWLSDNAKLIANGEKKFDGSDNEFYDCVQRIDGFITERSISVVHNRVDFETKAFNEALLFHLNELSFRFFPSCKSFIDSTSCLPLAMWVGSHFNTDSLDVEKGLKEGHCPTSFFTLSWDDYVSHDDDGCFKLFAYAIGPGNFDDSLNYLKDFLTGPKGRWIRKEFDDIKLGVADACASRRTESSVPP